MSFEGELWLQNICRKNEFDISSAQLGRLSRYVELLLDWNSRINLVSRKDDANIWTRHILGSVALLFAYDIIPGSAVADVGTGGGLPGIPLAICRPDVTFVLIDSIRKKSTAVTEIVSSLSLPNVSVVNGRAEELARTPAHKSRYDYVTARAVAPVSDIIGWCSGLLRRSTAAQSGTSADPRGRSKFIPPGSLILLKGGNVESEIASAKIKFRTFSYDARPLIVDGVGPDDLPDKKIIIIGSGTK